MTTATIQVEITSLHSAEKVFKVLCDFEVIAPKVNPSLFKSIETVEGKGGVGTIKLVTFGDSVPFTSGKFKVDAFDASNFSYTYTFFEGDNLMGIAESITHHIKITPSADGGSVYQHTVTYNCKDGAKPSEETLNFEKAEYEKTFKAMEAYGAAHPTIEVEIASSNSAEKVFKVFCDFEAIAPKVNPSVFKSIETIEGNGGVGTIKLITFGDGVPFTSGKFKVDDFDASNFSYTYTFFEGDNLMGITDSITHHIKISPSADGGSVYKQTAIYNCKGDAKPSEDILNFEKSEYEKTFKAMEAYGVAHPETY